MSNPRHKLEEAEYFLEGMKTNVKNDKVFSFNLSAFITAARSVTFFMQKESQNVMRFKDWYVNKQKLMDTDNDFKFLNEMRRATVHIRPVIANKKVSVSIVEPAVSVTDSVVIRVIRAGKVIEEHSSQPTKNIPSPIQSLIKYVYTIFRLLNKKSDSSKGGRSVSRFFKERPDEDLIKLCEKYLQKLRKLLDEYEQLFNRPS